MAPCVVVSRVFFSADELFRMEELLVCARADLIDDSRLEVDHHCSRHMTTATGLREEGGEGVVTGTKALVGRQRAIRLDAVFEAVQFPASEICASKVERQARLTMHFQFGLQLDRCELRSLHAKRTPLAT